MEISEKRTRQKVEKKKEGRFRGTVHRSSTQLIGVPEKRDQR